LIYIFDLYLIYI